VGLRRLCDLQSWVGLKREWGGESKGKGRGGSRDIEEGAAAGGITEVPTGRGESGAM